MVRVCNTKRHQVLHDIIIRDIITASKQHFMEHYIKKKVKLKLMTIKLYSSLNKIQHFQETYKYIFLLIFSIRHSG